MPELPNLVIVNDYHPAHRFLQALDPTAETFLFLAIKDRATKVTRQAFNYNTIASFDQWNADGWNLFVTVNETLNGTDTKRGKTDVTKLRCIFIDYDDPTALMPELPLTPSMVIESSPGKRQLYWFLDGGQPTMEEWDGVQQTLVNDYGGDKNARDASRVLRLPGFINRKYDHAPPCRILEDNGHRYTWQQIVEGFPPSQVTRATGQPLGEGLDVRLTMEQFISGENYHDSAIRLAGYYFNKGITREQDLIEHLQSLIDIQGDPSDPRFDQRRNIDIPASVAWILKKREEEQQALVPHSIEPLPEVEQQSGSKFTQLEWPPGFTGVLAGDIYNWMYYKNKEIAIVSALFMVAHFSGRKDSFEGVGLSANYKMYAPNGTGKDSVRRYLETLLHELTVENPDLLNVRHFELISGTFGVTELVKQLASAPSKAMLHSEEGISSASRSGDVDTLNSFFMQNQVKQPYTPLVVKTARDGIPPIYGVPIIRLAETTKEGSAHQRTSTVDDQIGATARQYKIYINHRPDSPDGEGRPNQVISPYIKEGVKKLIAEAMREEDTVSVVGNHSGCALNPVRNPRVFEASPEVADYLDEDYKRQVQRRKQTDDDDAGGLAWSQQARKTQLDKGMALLLARTEATINDGPATVDMTHMDYAIAFSAEAHRAEFANRDDYADAFTQCRSKFVESCRKGFTRGDGIQTVKMSGGGEQFGITRAWLNRRMQRYLDPIKEIYHGDTKRSLDAFINHFTGEDALFTPQTYIGADNQPRAIPGKWYINSHIVNPVSHPFKKSQKREPK